MTPNSADIQRLLEVEFSSDVPNYYELLGLAVGEDSLPVIDLAVRTADARLRAVTRGPDLELAQELMNQVAAAKLCLGDPDEKEAYDQAIIATSDSGDNNSGSKLEIKTASKQAQQSPLLSKLATPKSWSTSELVTGFLLSGLLIVGLVLLIQSFGESSPGSTSTNVPVEKDDLESTGQQSEAVAQNSESPRNGQNEIRPKESASKQIVPSRRPNYVTELPDGLQAEILYWFDASDSRTVEAIDDVVTTWHCKASGLSAELINPPRLASPNGRPTVATFSGEQGMILRSVGSFPSDRLTVAFVAVGKGTLFSKGDPVRQPNNSFSLRATDWMQLRVTTRLGVVDKQNSATDWGLRIITMTPEETAFYFNGKLTATRRIGLAVNGNDQPFSIGMRQSPDPKRNRLDFFEGDLGELMVFRNVLDSRQRAQVNDFLESKWR